MTPPPPNATKLKTIIKELLNLRGQDLCQTKLFTYESFATNKKIKDLFIYFRTRFSFIFYRYERTKNICK